jgi:hypothetical protein
MGIPASRWSTVVNVAHISHNESMSFWPTCRPNPPWATSSSRFSNHSRVGSVNAEVTHAADTRTDRRSKSDLHSSATTSTVA